MKHKLTTVISVMFLIVGILFLIDSQVVLGQIQSHNLSEITPIDTNLDLRDFQLNASYVNSTNAYMTNVYSTNLYTSIMYDWDDTTYFVNPAASTVAAIFNGNVSIGTPYTSTRLTVNGTLNVTNITLWTNCADGQALMWSNGVGQCGNPTTGHMSGFTLTADSGTNQDVNNSETIVINGGNGVYTTINTPNTFIISANLSDAGGLVIDNGGISLNKSCGANEVLKWNNTATAWMCRPDNTGAGGGMTNFVIQDIDTTSQTINDGNTITFLGGDAISVVVSATDTLTTNLILGSGSGLVASAGVGLTLNMSCNNDQILKFNSTSGNWECQPDSDSGGTMSSFTIEDDDTGMQTISDGEKITFSGGNGINTIVGGGDVVTIYQNLSPGGGLEFGVGNGLTLNGSCSDTQVLKYNSTSGNWECRYDNSTLVASGSGLVSDFSGISLNSSCSDTQVLKYNSTSGNWECRGDNATVPNLQQVTDIGAETTNNISINTTGTTGLWVNSSDIGIIAQGESEGVRGTYSELVYGVLGSSNGGVIGYGEDYGARFVATSGSNIYGVYTSTGGGTVTGTAGYFSESSMAATTSTGIYAEGMTYGVHGVSGQFNGIAGYFQASSGGAYGVDSTSSMTGIRAMGETNYGVIGYYNSYENNNYGYLGSFGTGVFGNGTVTGVNGSGANIGVFGIGDVWGGYFIGNVSVRGNLSVAGNMTLGVNNITTLGNGNIGVNIKDPERGLHLNNSGLKVTPNNPTLVNALDLSGTINSQSISDLEAEGNFVYVVSSGDDSLTIVDVGDSNNPQVVGYLQNTTTLNGASGIQVVGEYAYVVATNNYALVIINIADPGSPYIVGSYSSLSDLSGVNDIKIVGKHAFLSSSGDRIISMNISDPTNPTFLDSYIDASRIDGIYSLDVSGQFAYGCGYSSDVDTMIVLNITNVTDLTLSGSYTSSDYMDSCRYIGVVGTVAYTISGHDDMLTAMDVSDPGTPSYLGSFTDAEHLQYPTRMFVEGNLAVIGDGDKDGIILVDISDPTDMKFLGNYSSSTYFSASPIVSFNGNNLYAASTSYLVTLDMGGIDTTGLYASSAKVGTLDVEDNMKVNNNLVVDHALNVGPGGIYVDKGHGITTDGNLNVYGHTILLNTSSRDTILSVGTGRTDIDTTAFFYRNSTDNVAIGYYLGRGVYSYASTYGVYGQTYGNGDAGVIGVYADGTGIMSFGSVEVHQGGVCIDDGIGTCDSNTAGDGDVVIYDGSMCIGNTGCTVPNGDGHLVVEGNLTVGSYGCGTYVAVENCVITSGDLASCDEVPVGGLCETDGECGLDSGLNNCGTLEIYVRTG